MPGDEYVATSYDWFCVVGSKVGTYTYTYYTDPNGKVAADLWPCGAGKINLPSIGGEGDPHLDEIRRRDDSWGEYHGLIVGRYLAEIWVLGFDFDCSLVIPLPCAASCEAAYN